MKIILLAAIIISGSLMIYSQDINDTTRNLQTGSLSAPEPSEVKAENSLLSAKDIIRNARKFYLKQKKNLKSYDFLVYSHTLAKYHIIDNPIQFFTDYSGSEYNFLGASESEQYEYFKYTGEEKKKKIIVESQRQTDMLDKSFTNYFYPDFFEKELSLVNEKMHGPLAEDCFDYYTFKLVKVDSSSGKKIYEIRVKEKYKYIPSLNGTIFIQDSTFTLKQVKFKTNLAINIPLVKELNVNNKFENYLDTNTNQIYNILVSLNLQATASFAGAVKLKINSYLETRKFNFNRKQKGVNYDEFEIVVKPDANKKTKEYWDKNGIIIKDSLVTSELDKINVNKYNPQRFVKFTGTGLKFKDRLTWNFLYSYTFNRIEGNHIELNTTYERNFKRFLLDSRLIYGTANEQFSYSFNLALIPTKRLDVLIKAEVFSDVAPLFKKLGWINYIENAISTLLTRKDRVDYYKKAGFRLGTDYRISRTFTIGADFYQEKQSTVSNNTNFSFVKKNENYSINPTINDGTIKKISLTLNVDFNKYRMIDWGDGDVSRIRLSLLPVMEFRYSYSDKKIIKSTYDFKEYHVKVTGSVLLANAIKIIYKAGATLKYGAVPYQELNAVDPKFLGFPNDVSMITPDYSEFLGDRIVFFNFENEFGKIFPFNIPVLSSITLLGDLCFGKTWISDDNRKLSGDKNYKSTDGFFTEIGFGLTRILEIGTLRYSWRLNNFKEGSDTFLFFDVGIRY
jgi:hypothetical protein